MSNHHAITFGIIIVLRQGALSRCSQSRSRIKRFKNCAPSKGFKRYTTISEPKLFDYVEENPLCLRRIYMTLSKKKPEKNQFQVAFNLRQVTNNELQTKKLPNV